MIASGRRPGRPAAGAVRPERPPAAPAGRRPRGWFLAEGDLVVERALDAGCRPVAALVDPDRPPAVVGARSTSPVYAAGDARAPGRHPARGRAAGARRVRAPGARRRRPTLAGARPARRRPGRRQPVQRRRDRPQRRRPSAGTASCSTTAAPTRSPGGRCAWPWARRSRCRAPASTTSRRYVRELGAAGVATCAMTPAAGAVDLGDGSAPPARVGDRARQRAGRPDAGRAGGLRPLRAHPAGRRRRLAERRRGDGHRLPPPASVTATVGNRGLSAGSGPIGSIATDRWRPQPRPPSITACPADGRRRARTPSSCWCHGRRHQHSGRTVLGRHGGAPPPRRRRR